MGLRRFPVALLVVLAACGEKTAPSHEASVTIAPAAPPSASASISQPEASVAVPSSSASSTAAPGPVTHRVLSVATFVQSQLDECIDISIEHDGTTEVYPETAADKFMEAMKGEKDREVTRLKTSCMEAFKDRTVLSSCVHTAKEAKGTVTLASRNYRFETGVDSDERLKDCLKVGAKWEALPRDSDAFKDAERRHREKKLEKALDAR